MAPVKASAVDNEPIPFWNGADEDLHVERWRQRYFEDGYGTIGFADVAKTDDCVPCHVE